VLASFAQLGTLNCQQSPWGASSMKIIGQFMQIMTDNHIRHLPIGNGQKRMGLISIGDVVREMIAH
jgi:signal-transduction protein with cAMP-binding, CBS, and nucleotidyltransferase domain